MNTAEVILVLVALAFAFGCFVAAGVRSRADKATVERWKRDAERWNAYRARKKVEKKEQKALRKLVKSMRRPSTLPWEL